MCDGTMLGGMWVCGWREHSRASKEHVSVRVPVVLVACSLMFKFETFDGLGGGLSQ